MSQQYDFSTPVGLVSYFRARVIKREDRLVRRRKAGKAHPMDHRYIEHARDDLRSVQKLLTALPDLSGAP